MNSLIRPLALLIAVVPFGCRQVRHEACNPADSAAICTEMQKCFASDTSTVVCREAEHDALQMSKPNPLLKDNGGSGKALTY